MRKPKAKKATKSGGNTSKAPSKPARAKSGARLRWLDDKSGTLLIDRYARQLGSFLEAMADGEVDESEVKGQEARIVKIMKEVEPLLDDALHAKVTQLLCELTAYDIMQILHSMHKAKPKVRFRG
jgi:hypothetical protein